MAKGYRRLVLQIGRGDETRVPKSIPGRITVQNYSLKPSIRTDMQQASLIISHGGKVPYKVLCESYKRESYKKCIYE